MKAQAQPPRFEGKVALITGAGDRGIGAAIAERLAGEGAAIAIAGRSEPERLFKKLKKRGHGMLWRQCDVTKTEEIKNAVDACMENFGQIDIVVNNAGLEFAKRFEDCSESEWLHLLDVNLSGAIRTTRAALPYLPSPGGVIVNIASALALGGCASYSIYSASKAGMIGLTQSLAWEFGPRGIRVVCVAPALVHTPMTHKHVEHLTQEVWDQIETHHPLGMGLPSDVANAVAFLASAEARWITGVTLPLGWASAYPLPVEHFLKGE